jgi:hypothetical protein
MERPLCEQRNGFCGVNLRLARVQSLGLMTARPALSEPYHFALP